MLCLLRKAFMACALNYLIKQLQGITGSKRATAVKGLGSLRNSDAIYIYGPFTRKLFIYRLYTLKLFIYRLHTQHIV